MRFLRILFLAKQTIPICLETWLWDFGNSNFFQICKNVFKNSYFWHKDSMHLILFQAGNPYTDRLKTMEYLWKKELAKNKTILASALGPSIKKSNWSCRCWIWMSSSSSWSCWLSKHPARAEDAVSECRPLLADNADYQNTQLELKMLNLKVVLF